MVSLEAAAHAQVRRLLHGHIPCTFRVSESRTNCRFVDLFTDVHDEARVSGHDNTDAQAK